MQPPSTLWRFPGPLALAAVLRGERPHLHHPDATEVYLGDMGLWDWPGVAEFGALTVFDTARLALRPTETVGWYVADVVPVEATRVLYVPDRGCARAVERATDAAGARALLPPGYDAAVGEARRAMARYDAVSRRVVDAWRALGDDRVPADWRTLLETPLHMLPPGRRDGLAAALEAVIARDAESHRGGRA